MEMYLSVNKKNMHFIGGLQKKGATAPFNIRMRPTKKVRNLSENCIFDYGTRIGVRIKRG